MTITTLMTQADAVSTAVAAIFEAILPRKQRTCSSGIGAYNIIIYTVMGEKNSRREFNTPYYVFRRRRRRLAFIFLSF